MTFELFAWRFTFRIQDTLHFPAGKAGNILRGAFGTICQDARLFEPRRLSQGPSGLSDSPRPFVFRASHLDGRTFLAGDRFHFDLHVFISPDPPLSTFIRAFEQLTCEGLGPRRSKTVLESVWELNPTHEPAQSIYCSGQGSGRLSQVSPVVLPLKSDEQVSRGLLIRFVTPTELKAEKGIVSRPEFNVLFGRARDRISTLRSLYGGGSLDIDFHAMGERAKSIKMARCDLRDVRVERRSSRTGQKHSIGGFIGEVEYRGELTEFLPYLRVAEWTGVGRQTVWGKGEIRSELQDESLRTMLRC